MRARVENGRWILEDPTDLPEGTVVEIVTRPAPSERADVYVDEKIVAYVTALVVAAAGSPRANEVTALVDAAKARARAEVRGFVTPDGVKPVAPDVLRRLVGGASPDDAVRRILDVTPVP